MAKTSDWVLTIGNQYYMAFCPCLHAMDMCDHVGEGKCKGCLFGCFCPACFQCYMGKKIADKSDIEETMGMAVLKTICCSPCYGNAITVEYLKQVKDKPNFVSNKKWVLSITDQYKAICCPCLVGMDIFTHLGIEPSFMGGCMRCFLPPCFLCCVGPKIADLGDIPDSVPMAILKTICPCTEVCYATSVYVEYMYQKNKGIGIVGPKQQEMQ